MKIVRASRRNLLSAEGDLTERTEKNRDTYSLFRMPQQLPTFTFDYPIEVKEFATDN